ncbi:general substrate transporter [Penicillium argentinense]|uniref:General substrate transporter n=1 Tax=Penicillium argentinense TaxID=1131581 RepID=A0A9W9KKY2_9EURO|nr:general substrate transporter [Penicillium argentinense]KAJ5110130.1 general substrate transporter [Penicillium argentinense]
MWLEHVEGSVLTTYITFTCAAGFALFGYDQGIFGGLLQNESFVKTFNAPDSTLEGQITATYDLGCFFGALFAMWLGDKSGRKRTILWGCVVLIIGATIQATSFRVSQLIVGRFVAGLGNGMNTAAIPVWQSETAAARHRGRFIILQLFLNQVGNVIAQWINYGLTFVAGNSVAWRFPLAFQCVFAILTLIFLPWLPESPRWLIMKARNEEAFSVLKRLGASSRTEQCNTEVFNAIVQNVRHEMEARRLSFKALTKSDSLHTTRRVLLGAGTQLMQQWGGINVINYYLPVVFSSLGITRNLSLILSACNAMNLMISTCFGALYIETFGRKRMMLWGAVGQSVCFTLVAIGLALATKPWEAVAVAFVFAYYTTFGLSWIAVPWMYPAEINTQRMRIAGAGIATATNWINNYIVVLVTPIGISNIGWKYYLIYAVLNAVFVPVLGYFYVETAGLSLEQIDTMFESKYAIESLPIDSTFEQKTERSDDDKGAHMPQIVHTE